MTSPLHGGGRRFESGRAHGVFNIILIFFFTMMRKLGSVEILKGKQTVAFGGSLHLVLLPPPLQASQNIAIALRRLMKSSEKEGVRGMLPLSCLPLWGREGVTLRAYR